MLFFHVHFGSSGIHSGSDRPQLPVAHLASKELQHFLRIGAFQPFLLGHRQILTSSRESDPPPSSHPQPHSPTLPSSSPVATEVQSGDFQPSLLTAGNRRACSDGPWNCGTRSGVQDRLCDSWNLPSFPSSPLC